MNLFDSHTHVNLEAFDLDRNEVLTRAHQAGVTEMLNVVLAPDPEQVAYGGELIEKTPGMYGAVGIHPHDAKLVSSETLSLVRKTLAQTKMVALGEIGLDFHYNHSSREQQLAGLDRQLELALEVELPIIVHCREAFEETYSAVAKKNVFQEVGGVFHCFTGNKDEAVRVVDLGGYVSFSGILSFKTAEALRDAAKAVPLERLLIETDAPFLAPMPHRGKRNEPSYVVEVAKTLAQVKGCSVEEMAEVTRANAHTLFRI